MLNFYLIKELTRPTLLATFVLLSLVWLTQSLRFLDLMMNKGLGLSTFLHLTLLLVPFLLMFILPLSFFAGACLLFKRLNDDSELPPLFSSGLSSFKLIKPILLATVFVIALGYAISLHILPNSMVSFKNFQHHLRNSEGHLLLETGTFNQLGDGLMVYLKRRTSPYTMEGILVHDNRDEERPVTWMAQKGEIKASDTGLPQLILQEGIRQDITPNQVSMLQFKEHAVEVSRALKVPGPRSRAPEEYTISELQSIIQDKKTSQKDTYQLKAELHKRFLWPLTPLPLVLLAAAFLLIPRTRRSGVGTSLTIASLCAFTYQTLLIVAHSLAVGGMVFILIAQWSLPVVFSLIALLFIWRENR
ncbi:MAG: LptF/LptG family permease [Alphaproteobacteria bacterium]|nr:LptF/LptG family permease [Alphaproteobacteria bacterium]